MRLQGILKLRGDNGPVRARAARVDLHHAILQSPFPQQVRLQRDALGIGRGARLAHALGADLMELPLAAGLRPLRAKHRPHVEKPCRLGQFTRARKIAHYTRGAFGTKRKAPAAAVLKSVHFLLDHLGRVAQRPDKDFGVLKNGGADFIKVVDAENGAGAIFDHLPEHDLGRCKVTHALDGL